MAKSKSKKTLIRLISTAGTGYLRGVFRLRTCPPVRQVRYDPFVKRHVLFNEVKPRRGVNDKPKIDWSVYLPGKFRRA